MSVWRELLGGVLAEQRIERIDEDDVADLLVDDAGGRGCLRKGSANFKDYGRRPPSGDASAFLTNSGVRSSAEEEEEEGGVSPWSRAVPGGRPPGRAFRSDRSARRTGRPRVCPSPRAQRRARGRRRRRRRRGCLRRRPHRPSRAPLPSSPLIVSASRARRPVVTLPASGGPPRDGYAGRCAGREPTRIPPVGKQLQKCTFLILIGREGDPHLASRRGGRAPLHARRSVVAVAVLRSKMSALRATSRCRPPPRRSAPPAPPRPPRGARRQGARRLGGVATLLRRASTAAPRRRQARGPRAPPHRPRRRRRVRRHERVSTDTVMIDPVVGARFSNYFWGRGHRRDRLPITGASAYFQHNLLWFLDAGEIKFFPQVSSCPSTASPVPSLPLTSGASRPAQILHPPSGCTQ